MQRNQLLSCDIKLPLWLFSSRMNHRNSLEKPDRFGGDPHKQQAEDVMA